MYLNAGADPESRNFEKGGANLAKCGIFYYYTFMIMLAKRGR